MKNTTIQTTSHRQTHAFIFAAVLVLSLLTFSQAEAKESCKVKVNGKVAFEGTGSSETDAYEDAAMKCFERASHPFMSANGTVPEEAGTEIIDTCANIRCS